MFTNSKATLEIIEPNKTKPDAFTTVFKESLISVLSTFFLSII